MSKKQPIKYPTTPMEPMMLDGEIPPYNVPRSSTPKSEPLKPESPK